MGIGKLNTTLIDLIEEEKIKDESGFSTTNDKILASVRAYMEKQRETLSWANRATFSKATMLFRFRKIPGVEVEANQVIVCDLGRFRILSVEDVKNRKRYIEALCEEIIITGVGTS